MWSSLALIQAPAALLSKESATSGPAQSKMTLVRFTLFSLLSWRTKGCLRMSSIKKREKKTPDCCSAQSMNVVFVLWESSQRFQRDQTASKNMPLSGLICSPVGFRVTLQTLQEVYSVWSACGNQPESSLKWDTASVSNPNTITHLPNFCLHTHTYTAA